MNTILQKRIEEAAKKTACPQCVFNDGGTCNNDDDCKLFDDFVGLMTFALQNQWISVEEALPKCDKYHLAMYEDGGIIVAKYKNETWWWQDGFVVGRNTEGDLMYSSSCEVPSGLITHWMPIPEMKKGGEK